ncbi:PfkB family carbohydrate kinase [Aquibium microcysteis]|uniref:PfkB family carbohydrate kinase n=1 Tax=Aquibium microcysteis TaxID=675281 RepID=UPI00165D2C56|nr:PfkB family carbohydrate kinase [Aquibium microcysteis]
MGSVLVVGALHHDVIVTAQRLPVLDETLPGTGVTYALGGKGGNQALAAARLGASVAFAGRVGRDEAGAAMTAQLAAGGVDVSRIAVDPALASGMSVAIVTQGGDYGAVIVSAANGAIDGGSIALPHDCGLVLLQNEVPEAANLAVARKAAATGARVVLNAAPARAVPRELLSLTDVLVVNRVEAEMIGRGLDGFRGTLIETRGDEGCILRSPGEATRHVAAFPVGVVSTHGAGDCFTGALAARLAAGGDLGGAVSFAAAAAALHVSMPVARRGTLTAADVTRLSESGPAGRTLP